MRLTPGWRVYAKDKLPQITIIITIIIIIIIIIVIIIIIISIIFMC